VASSLEDVYDILTKDGYKVRSFRSQKHSSKTTGSDQACTPSRRAKSSCAHSYEGALITEPAQNVRRSLYMLPAQYAGFRPKTS